MRISTSSSDRYDAARKALALRGRDSARLAATQAALRALIEPPATEETPEELAERIAREYGLGGEITVTDAIRAGIHAGIQAAWNSWEPETVPGHEQEHGIHPDWRDDQENMRGADSIFVEVLAFKNQQLLFGTDFKLTEAQAIGMFQGIGEASE